MKGGKWSSSAKNGPFKKMIAKPTSGIITIILKKEGTTILAVVKIQKFCLSSIQSLNDGCQITKLRK